MGDAGNIEERLSEELASRAGGLRRLRENMPSIDFASNDYLGLSQLISGVAPSADYRPGSRLISGNHPSHLTLENWASNFWNVEAATFYPSGYMANNGLFSCLLKKGDTYLYDELIHASIRDGLRLSPARSHSFAHNDLEDLEAKLKRAQGQVVVITESVFSMDGDLAPLESMQKLISAHGAEWIVDEAHATGVFGPEGRGCIDSLNLRSSVLATIHTLGKGVGAHGALVLGSKVLKEYQVNFSRPFIYTTATPPHHVQEVQDQLQKMKGAQNLRDSLWGLCEYFENQIDTTGLRSLMPRTESPIKTLVLGDVEKVKKTEEQLAQRGVFSKAILSPTVPKGTERLRICLHAYNTRNEVDVLLETVISENLQTS